MENLIKSLVNKNSEINKILENVYEISYKEMYKILNTLYPDQTADLIELIKFLKNESYFDNKINDFKFILNEFNEYLNNNDFVYNIKLINDIFNSYLDLYDFDYTDKFLFISDKQNYNYIITCITLMMQSENLINFESNPYLRYKYILENQIFVVSEFIEDNFVYKCLVDINNEFSLNICNEDFLSNNFNIWNIKKFTTIFGTPRVLTESKKRYETCAYHLYVTKALTHSHVTMLLTPSKWFQSDISYLRILRNDLITYNKLRLIKHFYEVNPVGGISYFIHDNNYNGECFINGYNVNLNNYDIVLTEGKYYSLLDKFKAYPSINTRFVGNGWTKIATNDERL